MSGADTARGLLAGGLLLMGGLAASPAQAEPAGPTYTGWVQREDGAGSEPDRTYAVSGAQAGLHLITSGAQVGVYSDGYDGPGSGTGMAATFVAPGGKALEVGTTYRVDITGDDPTFTGRFQIWRDGTMCGKTEQELVSGFEQPPSATGWFRVGELERDASGVVTRFAATYEINCQYVGGQAGFEGSVAVDSAAPAVAVPEEPATPGAVTGLTVANAGPNGGGQNTTTLTWTNPAGFGDVNLDLIQVVAGSRFPALLGANLEQRYRGRGNRYSERWIDFMDTRTYRLVPRSTYGRLGPASLVTVMGSRFSTSDPATITIGQRAEVSGRLSESVPYDDPADVLKGPGLVGRTVTLCEQSTRHYVDAACTRVDRTVTGADGRFTMTARPRENSMYSATVKASGDLLGNTTVVFTALVAPQTDLRAAEAGPARSSLARTAARKQVGVRRGAVIHFTTSRARVGSTGLVRLQRFNGRRWRTIAIRSLGPSSARGRLAIPYRERTRGQHAYRVVKLADARHVNGHSRVVHVTVR